MARIGVTQRWPPACPGWSDGRGARRSPCERCAPGAGDLSQRNAYRARGYFEHIVDLKPALVEQRAGHEYQRVNRHHAHGRAPFVPPGILALVGASQLQDLDFLPIEGLSAGIFCQGPALERLTKLVLARRIGAPRRVQVPSSSVHFVTRAIFVTQGGAHLRCG